MFSRIAVHNFLTNVVDWIDHFCPYISIYWKKGSTCIHIWNWLCRPVVGIVFEQFHFNKNNYRTIHICCLKKAKNNSTSTDKALLVEKVLVFVFLSKLHSDQFGTQIKYWRIDTDKNLTIYCSLEYASSSSCYGLSSAYYLLNLHRQIYVLNLTPVNFHLWYFAPCLFLLDMVIKGYF